MLTKEQNQLVEQYLPLAYDRAAKMYKEYSYKLVRVNTPLEDVISEATLGLIRAIQKFDESHGCKLITYATIYIDSYTRKYILRNNCILKLPRNDQLKYDIHQKNIDFLRACISGVAILNLEAPIFCSEGKEILLSETLEDKSFNLLMEELLILIDQVLTDQEFKVFYEYFVLDRNQTEIGDELGVHQVHISRILKRAKTKVKEVIRNNMI